MALSRPDSRRMYSWWWDSHNTPRNSKWLQENLTDIDVKVKSMIKLIEEDADSFARRAEMYYKKRPELMKLVEEFYRAYRALAERYNHATGELRHAHRTLAKAFPDQVPPELAQDSGSKPPALANEPHTPSPFDGDEFPEDEEESPAVMNTKRITRRALNFDNSEEKKLNEKVNSLSAENDDLKERVVAEGERATKAETEIESLKRALADIQAEKENVLLEYQICVSKLSFVEVELSHAERDSTRFNEITSRAEIEIRALNEALVEMEAEKNAGLTKHKEYLEKICRLEDKLSRAEEIKTEAQSLREEVARLKAEKNAGLMQQKEYLEKICRLEDKLSRAEETKTEAQSLREEIARLKAEKNAGLMQQKEYLEKICRLEDKLSRAEETKTEAQSLREEISRLKHEKEEVLNKYKECLEKTSALKDIISLMENEAGLFKKRAEIAEAEVSELKKSMAELNDQKEVSAIRYKCCMERMSKLEEELSDAKTEVKQLNDDVFIGNLKLKQAEDKYTLLEVSNQSLRNEAENLMKMIAVKDRELSEKQNELETLQSCLRDENLHRAQIESTLETLRNLHSQSQEDQRALASELKQMLQMVNNLEVNKQGLEEAYQLAQDENKGLSERNSSVASSMENLKDEIFGLNEIKSRLEKEVSRHIGLSESLQEEISSVKAEIKGLNEIHQALVEQVEATGLSPKSLPSAVKSLRDENALLKRNYEKGNEEKAILSKKLETMQELIVQNVIVETSYSDLSSELERSEKEMYALQESFQSLQVENTGLIAEKASLLSQLQAVTENMHKLLEKNAVLEHTLSSAKLELEVLREKSRGLEEICELLKKERSYILSERDSYLLNLETVERRLESVEKRCMGLEEKYASLEKEKEAMHLQVQKLEVSLSMEKQERTNSQVQGEIRVAGLEKHIHHLEEENKWQRKEFQDELERSLKAQFEFSALQKFIKDVEEKNFSLITECQKHVEASKLAEKLISELESESLEQQVETELLLDEIERLRLDIYDIFRALDTNPDCAPDDQIGNDKTYVSHILGIIENMKSSLTKHEDDKQLCLVENSVLLTLLEQLESRGMEIESEKISMEKELKTMANKIFTVKLEKDQLLELNRKLRSELSESHKQSDELLKAYGELEQRNLQLVQDNKNLSKNFSDLNNEKFRVDQYIEEVLLEHIASVSHSSICKSFTSEKTAEISLILQELENEHETSRGLKRDVEILSGHMESQKGEMLLLRDNVQKLERELQRMREYNVQLKKDVQSGKDSLFLKEKKLMASEMKLEAAEKRNTKLFKTVDELQLDSVHARKSNSILKEKIDELESEVDHLRREKTTVEQSLVSELQEKNSKLQILEGEATAFYFEFQMSTVRDIIYRNKVQELAGICNEIWKDNASKTKDVELMKGRNYLLQNKIYELKSKLFAYSPIVVGLEDDVAALEQNAALQAKLKASRNQDQEILDSASSHHNAVNTSEMLAEKSLQSLQSLQSRIRAVGKMFEESNSKQLVLPKKQQQSYVLTNEIENLKHRRFMGRDTPKLHKIKTKPLVVRDAMRMKDIPLDEVVSESKRVHIGADDQMLVLWETPDDRRKGLTIADSLVSYKISERDVSDYNQSEVSKFSPEAGFTDSDYEKDLSVEKWLPAAKITETASREVSSRRVLERLSSDAKRLENLRITVENLRLKLGACKKSSKFSKNVDFETVQEQLIEAEETVMQLVNLNAYLVKNIEGCPATPPGEMPLSENDDALTTQRRRVTEKARKGSERIGRLQLELQKIQYILLKMEDEKNKARTKCFRNRTIILRDFIYYGRKNSGKRKKGSYACGCFRPATTASRNGRIGSPC